MNTEGSGGRPDRHPPKMAVGTTAATFQRKALGHLAPSWVKSGALFFLTICCETRGSNQLCLPDTSAALLESVRFYHEQGRWFARLFLLMPDHLHALLAFPPTERMNEVVRNWKSYTARQHGIRWQRNFFDHRLRNDENVDLKAHYIRENPVRKRLVAIANEWPHVLPR